MWPVILTGVFTLAGAFGGAWLSNRQAVERVQIDRANQHRTAVRADIGELIAAARAHIEMTEALLPGFGRMTTDDLTEFVDTDSGKLLRERRAIIDGALVRLRLLVADDPLRKDLQTFSALMAAWPEKVMGPAVQASSAADDGVFEGLRSLAICARALKSLEDSAIDVLRETLPAQPKR